MLVKFDNAPAIGVGTQLNTLDVVQHWTSNGLLSQLYGYTILPCALTVQEIRIGRVFTGQDRDWEYGMDIAGFMPRRARAFHPAIVTRPDDPGISVLVTRSYKDSPNVDTCVYRYLDSTDCLIGTSVLAGDYRRAYFERGRLRAYAEEIRDRICARYAHVATVEIDPSV